jgi:hypothetical protein
MSTYETQSRTAAGEFRKSSLSEAMGNCVEVAFMVWVAVRDSKDPDGPALYFTPEEWAAFIGGARAGEFDLN